jgi:hypothetical protein
VYYNEEFVTNSKFQTQLSQKLHQFRTYRKNKKCSIFHELSEYINFFDPKNEGVPHLKNCWPRLKKVVKSTASALNRPPFYTPMSLKLATFYEISISKFRPQFRFRPFQFRRITTNENSQKICTNHENNSKINNNALPYLLHFLTTFCPQQIEYHLLPWTRRRRPACR